jgi:dTDP-4-amino-4,6-dideoxy-D-glucose acyltransferase
MAYYSEQELKQQGFASLGENVLISQKASIYGHQNIHIGNNVRIDDFAVLSAGEGGIYIGSYIHIAVFCLLIGSDKISLADYCNLSSRVAIYSNNDDYSGEFMTNPMVGTPYTNVLHAPVTLDKHVIVGCGTVILPDTEIGEGVAIGALSLVNKTLAPWGIYAGQPARFVKPRSKALLEQERLFLQHRQNT